MSNYEDEIAPEEDLIHYVRKKNLTEVKQILEINKGKLNFDFVEPKTKNTALHFAANSNNLQIVTILLEYGHPIDKIKNKNNKTAQDCMSDELKTQLGPLIVAISKPVSIVESPSTDVGQSNSVQTVEQVGKITSITKEPLEYYHTVEKRLEEFVRYFIKHFESKLLAYHKVLEGETKKAGKVSDACSSKIGQVVGAVGLGVLMGSFLGPAGAIAGAKKGMLLGKATEWVGDKIGEGEHRKKVVKLAELVYATVSTNTAKSQLRKTLAESGFDLFQSFEMQFMRVTKDDMSQTALKTLAKDATNRAISYFLEHSDALITEAVIRGKSKSKISSKIIDSGFKIEYQHYSSTEDWNTAQVFEKPGLVLTDQGPNPDYYEMKDGTSKSRKYGFRRLLTCEDWSYLKGKYEKANILDSSQFTDYQYVLNKNDYEKRSEEILKNYSKDMIDFPALGQIIEEVKSDLLEEFSCIKKSLSNLDENDKTILSRLEENFTNLKLDEYIKPLEQMLQNYSEKASLEHQEIKESVDQLHEKVEGVSSKLDKLTIQEMKFFLKKWWPEEKPLVNSFVERTENDGEFISDQIHNALIQNYGAENGVFRKIVITGLGGIGKTTTAKWYANKYEHAYAHIVWIHSDTPVLRNSFKNLADTLNIPLLLNDNKTEKPLVQIVKEIYTKIEENCTDNCLFIFDNAEEYDEIKNVLPDNKNAKFYSLITSRNQNWGRDQTYGTIPILKLGVFSEKEAIKFIRGEYTLGGSASEGDAESLSKALGRLPLALQQAVAFIKSSRTKLITDYLVLFKEVKYNNGKKTRTNFW